MTRILIWISRYLLAITFIFSGLVKGVDPLGSAYKFGDYFMAFGLDFLLPTALPLSFVLCAAELFIGLALLLRVQNRVAAWGALLFMAAFTPLTLVLAIFNPVSDCGCFGDAIILTNWETFFKNIPLLLASIFLVSKRNRISGSYSKVTNYAIASFALIISFIPSIHGYYNLPVFDFRPYKIGTNIAEAMSYPPNAPVDEYKTLLYYQKEGITKEFTQENFPWQDTTWKFVDSKSILLKKGYTPPISGFSLTDVNEIDITDSILNHPGYYILAVSYKLNLANQQSFAKLNELYFKAKELGIGFACVTASTSADIDKFVSRTGVAFPFLQADEIMLKTTVRANPGIILLNQGTILAKWHHRNLPESQFFEGNLAAKALAIQRDAYRKTWIYLIVTIATLGLFSLSRFAKKE